MASIFSRIIAGEIPCCRIAEDERFFAFLDIRPIAPGHTLVIPKFEVDRFFDMEEALLSGILPFARPIVRAIERVVPCERVGLLVAGLAVPHAHLHLVPMRGEGDLSFANARAADPAELKRLAERIRAELL